MRLLLIFRDGASSRRFFQALQKEHDIEQLLIEEPPSATAKIKARWKRRGLAGFLDEMLLRIWLLWVSRVLERKTLAKLEAECFEAALALSGERVTSVNDSIVCEALRNSTADRVIINGTKIVSPATIQASSVPILNTHMGITPGYRGVQGLFWALAMGDTSNVGVTTHAVDEGIDTGKVLVQKRLEVLSPPSFCELQLLQQDLGMNAVLEALNSPGPRGKLINGETQVGSRLWTHPGLSDYIKARLAGRLG